jgi:hypothetical protein
MSNVQIWSHVRSGDTFAVVIKDGIVTSAIGPLDSREIDECRRGGWEQNSDMELVDDLNAAPDDYRPIA